MSKLVPPHGSDHLMPLLIAQEMRAEALEKARALKAVPMSSRETSDFLMLGMGAYTPLTGFMGHDDWHSVCAEMKITTDLFWPIPITLSCSKDLADDIAIGESVALVDVASA